MTSVAELTHSTMSFFLNSYLKIDYSLDCNSPKHRVYTIIAGVMVIIYPICVPFSYWFMLFKLRSLINGGQKVKEKTMVTKEAHDKSLEERAQNEEAHPSLKSMRFLYENYQPKFWWFEVFETLRKLSLTGFLVFLAPGTGLQIGIAMMITMFSLRVYVKLQPFQDPFANKLAEVAQWQLLVTIFCALAIKVKLDGLQDHQSFDSFLTSIQVIPVLLVTFYFIGIKINSKEEGSASVLPILSAEGEEIENEEVKEEGDENTKEGNTREGQSTASVDNKQSNDTQQSNKRKAKRVDPTLFKLLTTRREDKT